MATESFDKDFVIDKPQLVNMMKEKGMTEESIYKFFNNKSKSKQKSLFKDLKSMAEHLDGYWDALADAYDHAFFQKDIHTKVCIRQQMTIIGEILQDLKPLVERENNLKKLIDNCEVWLEECSNSVPPDDEKELAFQTGIAEMVEELKELLELD